MIDFRSVLRGLAALSLLGIAAALLLATPAMAQQGPGGPPPPNPATPVQDNELVETWNERVSAGPPVGVAVTADGEVGNALSARRESGEQAATIAARKIATNRLNSMADSSLRDLRRLSAQDVPMI